jgi:hypothetical protein
MIMDSVYYGLSLLAIFVIIKWSASNDRVPPNKPTKGLLAMKFNESRGECKETRAATLDSRKQRASPR